MKILVRATNWVGDAIVSIPALVAIRTRWPNAEITVLARPWVADLYSNSGWCDSSIALPAAGSSEGHSRALREIRSKRFDQAILFPNSFHAAWLAWSARIPERIGYARDGRSLLLTQAVAVPKPGEIPDHEVYYYLELVRRAGWIDSLPQVDDIRLAIAPAAIATARERLEEAGARKGKLRIAFGPGAAYGSAKCWPPERFAELGDRLIADCDADVILFGTVSERETTERIAARMRHSPVNFSGQTSIGDLPSLFAACSIFIGNDSGAMHVAAAAGLPVVAVFGPTDAEGTAPLTRNRVLVSRNVSCAPCFLRHCPIDHRCMERIEVDAVYAAALLTLENMNGG
jgi:lipopolysaccharide heptosyltransferase II